MGLGRPPPQSIIKDAFPAANSWQAELSICPVGCWQHSGLPIPSAESTCGTEGDSASPSWLPWEAKLTWLVDPAVENPLQSSHAQANQ